MLIRRYVIFPDNDLQTHGGQRPDALLQESSGYCRRNRDLHHKNQAHRQNLDIVLNKRLWPAFKACCLDMSVTPQGCSRNGSEAKQSLIIT